MKTKSAYGRRCYAKVPQMAMPQEASKTAYVEKIDIYGNVHTARLQLTLCKTCFGCNRLEDKDFEGLKKCTGYIKAKGG